MGALDLPSEREETAEAERAGGNSADLAKAPKTPDPDERGQAYEAVRAHVSAETRDEASAGLRPDVGDQRSYWDQVPRFHRMWANHQRLWSERSQAAHDRSGDRPATAEDVGRIRDAESRLSADAQAVEQENKHGGWLAGFKHRLKSEVRLQEKITEKLAAEKLSAEPRMTAAEALHEIADAIRYTYCFQPENYTKGYYDIKERFESRGHEMYYSENSWTNPEYKGINTRWVTTGEQRFEIQFHSPESFHAKHHVTHLAYERIRGHGTRRAELRELHDFQREVSSHIRVPDGATDIPSYRKEGF